MLRWFITALLMLMLPGQNLFAHSHFAERPEVKSFIKKMVHKHKFNQKELVSLFDTVAFKPAIIKQFNTPFEAKPWYLYQRVFVNEWRIQHGLEFWEKHAQALMQAEKKYGVPASIIVATIGIETRYGTIMGTYRVLDSLSNLAFSNLPRAKFFQQELEQFLLLTREQHINPNTLMGSYAGAIGQPQFMPSSYRKYAVSTSEKGGADLVHNEDDIIASIANYYKQNGWKYSQPIAVPAAQLPHNNTKLTLVELQGYLNNEYWLGFHNFDVIKKYNSSNLYAMAVFQLSHYIATLRNKLNNG